MPRPRKTPAPDEPPCRPLALAEAAALLLVSRQQGAQTLTALHQQAPALRRYELGADLGSLALLRLVVCTGQGYALQPGARTEAALARAWEQVKAASEAGG